MTTLGQTVWPGPSAREHGPEARATLASRLLAIALMLIFAAQCAWFVGTQSFTVDEPTNLWIGVQHWRGHPEIGNDNPPLLRLLCSLPLLGTRVADVAAANFESAPAFDPIALAWRTRLPNVLLGLLLACALWNAARRRFSPGAANFALALFAFSPPLIAHFSIVGTDGIAALMIFVTALQVAAFRRNPSWRQTLLTGVVLGLLLLAKLYTIPMFALALLLVALPSPLRLRAWHWGKVLAVVAIGGIMLWGCYLFTVSKLVIRDHQVWLDHHGIQTNHHAVPVNWNLSIPVPAPDYLRGISFQWRHGRVGDRAYLLGNLSENGWRYYFPVAMALKWPTMVLLLGFATGVMAALRRIRLPEDFGTIFLFPLSFFALAIFSTVNVGDRYLLPVYPFVLLFVAALYPHPPLRLRPGQAPAGRGAAPSLSGDNSPPKTGRARRAEPGGILVAVLVLAAALNAADALRYAPGYLSYFTVFVRPQQAWRYLSDSSTDWGQGLIALRNYEQEHRGEQLHVAYWRNGLGPDVYGVNAPALEPNERPTGTVVVSPGVLSGQNNANPEAYRWVLKYPLRSILDHDLLVFDVPR